MALTGTAKIIRDGAEDFAKTHPIAPLDEFNLDDHSVARSKPGDRHTMRSDRRLYSGTLNKRSVPHESANLSYVLNLQTYQANTAVPAGSFLCWYLPWNPGGGSVDMTIPDGAVADNTGANVNPPLFFTTQLSGCSVFVRGTPAKPEVFHAGTAGAVTWQGSSAVHWREIFAAARPHAFQKGTFAEVSRNDYVGQKVFGQKVDTPLVENYITQLKAFETHMARPFTLIDYMGIGCVFGVRDLAGAWSFFLQENIRVGYSRHTVGLPVLTYANRVLRLSRIFPGAKTVIFTNAVPKPLP